MQGDHEDALTLIRDAVDGLTPGVERPYLVHHRHCLVARANGEAEEARMASLMADELLREALSGLAESEFDRAVNQVPEHQAIVASAAVFAPVVVAVELPAMDAPSGKVLDNHELRTVQWTIEHPEDQLFEDEIERRRARLKRLMKEASSSGARPSMDDLAKALSVSASTVRRDLDSLRAAGHSLHTRGQRDTG
jgi:DNA-binding transcriptional ArsR family regulator